jgi:hypothetical protein
MFLKIVATASQSRIPLSEVSKLFEQSRDVRISMEKKFTVLREALNGMMKSVMRKIDVDCPSNKTESNTDDIPPPSTYLIKSRCSSRGDDRGDEGERRVPGLLPESTLCIFGHISKSRSSSITEYSNSVSASTSKSTSTKASTSNSAKLSNSKEEKNEEKRILEKALDESTLLQLASGFLDEDEEGEEKKEFKAKEDSMDSERWNILVKMFMRKLFLSHFVEGFIKEYKKCIPVTLPAVRSKVQSPYASPILPHLRSRSTPGSFACTSEFPVPGGASEKNYLNCSMNLTAMNLSNCGVGERNSTAAETSRLKSILTDKLVKGNRYNTAINIESRKTRKKLISVNSMYGNENEEKSMGIGGVVKKLFFSDIYNGTKTTTQEPQGTNPLLSPRPNALPTIPSESTRLSKYSKEKKFRFSDLHSGYDAKSPENTVKSQHSIYSGRGVEVDANLVINTAKMFTRQFGSKRCDLDSICCCVLCYVLFLFFFFALLSCLFCFFFMFLYCFALC